MLAAQARRRWACRSRSGPTASGPGAGRVACGRRGHAALPRGRHRLQAPARRHALGGRRRRDRHARTSSPGGSATSRSCVGWARTSAPRATTPWSGASHRLSGAPVRAPDIRAGAALVLAGLVADGRDGGQRTPTTSTAATRTWPARCARSAPGCRAREREAADRRPDPSCSSEARDGRPRRAGPPALLRRARRRAARAVARLAYRADVRASPWALTGAPGRGQVDADRPADRRARCRLSRRRERRGRRPIDQVGVLGVDPTSPFSGGRDPRGPRPDAGARARRPRLHPVDGDARAPRRALAGGARRGSRARRGGLRRSCIVETVGVGQMEVEIAVGRRHHRGRRDPGLGRLHAGQQGRPARGRRRVRHQQGGPPRGRARRGATCEQMLDLSAPGAWRPADRRDDRHRRARGSTGCGPPSLATGRTWSVRAD